MNAIQYIRSLGVPKKDILVFVASAKAQFMCLQELSLAELRGLSEFFGTDDITVTPENVNHCNGPGCCSSSALFVSVNGITQNLE